MTSAHTNHDEAMDRFFWPGSLVNGSAGPELGQASEHLYNSE